MAKIKVDTAISESDSMINAFRLNRSAHTPANGDKKKVGKNPQIIAIVIITPDWVFIVIYHIMAY
jgi:hypothetical protein